MSESENVEVFNYNNNAVLFLLLALVITLFNFLLNIINQQSSYTSTTSYGPYYTMSSSCSLQIFVLFSAFYLVNNLFEKANSEPDGNWNNYGLGASITLILISCGMLVYNVYANYT